MLLNGTTVSATFALSLQHWLEYEVGAETRIKAAVVTSRYCVHASMALLRHHRDGVLDPNACFKSMLAIGRLKPG